MDIVFLPPTFSLRPRRFVLAREIGRACMAGISIGLTVLVVATLTMAIFTVADAQTITAAPVTTEQPLWVAALQPVIGALVLAVAGIVATLISGLGAKLSAYLVANKQAAAAAMVADANTVIHAALMTSASTISGKIQTGQLDYTNRAAWQTEAERELAMVEQRVPGAIATAAPIAGALLASLMSKVDMLQVSATPLVALPAGASSVVDTISAATKTLADARAALAPVPPTPAPVAPAGVITP